MAGGRAPLDGLVLHIDRCDAGILPPRGGIFNVHGRSAAVARKVFRDAITTTHAKRLRPASGGYPVPRRKTDARGPAT